MWTLSQNKLPTLHSASYCSQPTAILYSRLFCSVDFFFFLAIHTSTRPPLTATVTMIGVSSIPAVVTGRQRFQMSSVMSRYGSPFELASVPCSRPSPLHVNTACRVQWREWGVEVCHNEQRGHVRSRTSNRSSKMSCFWFYFIFTSSIVIAVPYTGPGTTSMKCEVGVDKTVYRDKEKKIKTIHFN